jgi:hypothetical protein
MSEQEQRGGQPESTDENAPAPIEQPTKTADGKPAAGSQPDKK